MLIHLEALCVILFIIWLIIDNRKKTRAYRALYEDNQAGEALDKWLRDNPHINPSENEYSKWLVLRKIITYNNYLSTHPHIQRNANHENWLTNLLYKKNISSNDRTNSGRRTFGIYSLDEGKRLKLVGGLDIENRILSAKQDEREFCAKAVCQLCQNEIVLTVTQEGTIYHIDPKTNELLPCNADAIWKLTAKKAALKIK